MLKLNAGFSRKVGEPNYSSRGASVNVELEVESGLITDPDALMTRIRNLFGIAKRSVDAELGSAPSNTNDTAHASGYAGNRRPADGEVVRIGMDFFAHHCGFRPAEIFVRIAFEDCPIPVAATIVLAIGARGIEQVAVANAAIKIGIGMKKVHWQLREDARYKFVQPVGIIPVFGTVHGESATPMVRILASAFSVAATTSSSEPP